MLSKIEILALVCTKPKYTIVLSVKSENTSKHDIQESQEASPFPIDDHKSAMNRQESMTNGKHK